MGTSSSKEDFLSMLMLFFLLCKWPFILLSCLRFVQVLQYHHQMHTLLRLQVRILQPSTTYIALLCMRQCFTFLPSWIFNSLLLGYQKLLFFSVYSKYRLLGLWPLSHKERRQELHAWRVPRHHSILIKFIMFLSIIPMILGQGLMITWKQHYQYRKSFHVNKDKSRHRIDGRQCLFNL